MADFLLEIGLEEIPARMIDGAEAELRKRVEELLEREALLVGPSERNPVLATPARVGHPVGHPGHILLRSSLGTPGSTQSRAVPHEGTTRLLLRANQMFSLRLRCPQMEACLR